MKKITLLFIFLGTTLCSFAQPAALERLIGTSTYMLDISGGGFPTMAINDSVSYKYSNGRGSDFNFTQIDNADMITDDFAMFDSSLHFMRDQAGFKLNSGRVSTYDNANKRISLITKATNGGTTLENETDTRYEYNTAGKVSVEHTLSWNSPASKWDSVSRLLYTYDGQNKVLTTTMFDVLSHQLDSRLTYHYDMAGNQDTILNEIYDGSWNLSDRTVMTYTGNKVKTSKEQEYDGNSMKWENIQLDSFGYTPNVDFYTYHRTQEWNTDENVWVNRDREMRTAIGQKFDEQTIDNWNEDDKVWETQAKVKWSYNMNGNPSKFEATSPQIPFPIPVVRMNFYYEQYFRTSVADIKKKEALVIYPNPASDAVSIKLAENTGNYINITVTNVSGQTISVSRVKPTNGEAQLSLLGMQTGTYHVSVQYADGTLAAQTIVKQ